MRTPHYESLPEASKDRIAEAMRLAEHLEGEVVTIDVESRRGRRDHRLRPQAQRHPAFDRAPAAAALDRLAARDRGAQELLRKADALRADRSCRREDEDARRDVDRRELLAAFGHWNEYALAAAGVGLAAAAAYAVSLVLPLPNIPLVFMTAVILVAIYIGRGPSILASILSFFAYNIFFTKPYYNFSGFRRDDLLTIVFFLLVSVIVGNLAARLKVQINSMRQSAQRTANLYEFSRKIAAAASLEDVLWAAVHHVASTLQSSSLVLLPQKDRKLQIAAGYPPEDQLALKDRGAAEWAWEHAQPAGWKSDTLPAADWLFLPMKTRRGMVGLLGVSFKDRQRPLAPDQWRLLGTLVDQVAVAVERTNLASDIEEARLLTETEQLRSALLSSVSHDLRTPLVSILGSATTPARMDNLTETSRKELVTTILDESERLNRFVQNLLDMTRLGYGALQPKREWYDLREISGRAMKQLSKGLDKRHVTMDIQASLPLVHVDPVLMEQVFVNVLDNAVKYTAEGGEIAIEANQSGEDLTVRISDDGVGIPPEARNAVFDIFYRVRAKDFAGGGNRARPVDLPGDYRGAWGANSCEGQPLPEGYHHRDLDADGRGARNAGS